MTEEKVPMSGWKVKTGTIIAIVGIAILSSVDVFSNPNIIMWSTFIGKLLAGIGGGLASWGLGHKMEKAKTTIQLALKSTLNKS